ncbi:MAG: 50S ribosomal protein L36 [Alphaproteobacteria bacterium]|nr:50S ribosomal protein L36 [Alphaproteobacteria bacterium]
MKVKTSIRVRDKYDQIVKRRGRLFLINKKNPRRKSRQK